MDLADTQKVSADAHAVATCQIVKSSEIYRKSYKKGVMELCVPSFSSGKIIVQRPTFRSLKHHRNKAEAEFTLRKGTN